MTAKRKLDDLPPYSTARVCDLVPYARNSRTHSEAQVAQIAASIKEFGFTTPILTDGENGVIAGHGRILAAQKLGMETVPVVELSHLSETQRKAYILADNKLALNAGWDDNLLADEIVSLRDLDFDLDVIGFDEDDVLSILGEKPKLNEFDDPLRAKEYVRCLISIPIDLSEEAKPMIDQLQAITGVEVDYGAN